MEVAAGVVAGKCLTFKLCVDVYGLDIRKVQAIFKMMDVTRMSSAPDFVLGVINLPGKVIPVVDLRVKFAMNAKEAPDQACVLVVQIAQAGVHVTVGLIIDEISEVVDMADASVAMVPGAAGRRDCIVGVAKVAQQAVMLLDVDKLFSGSELAVLPRVGKHEASEPGSRQIAETATISKPGEDAGSMRIVNHLHAAVQPKKAEKTDTPKPAEASAARHGVAKAEDVLALDNKERGNF